MKTAPENWVPDELSKNWAMFRYGVAVGFMHFADRRTV